MTSNKDILNRLIEQYNFFVSERDTIVVTEEPKYIKIELGGHWSTKVFTISPTDGDYKKLLELFFSYMCRMTCNNRPTYITTNDGK